MTDRDWANFAFCIVALLCIGCPATMAMLVFLAIVKDTKESDNG